MRFRIPMLAMFLLVLAACSPALQSLDGLPTGNPNPVSAGG